MTIMQETCCVGRQIAHLSHDLASAVLPHDQFESQLDLNGVTIHTELEKKNFLSGAETLATIWSRTVTDGYEVDA